MDSFPTTLPDPTARPELPPERLADAMPLAALADVVPQGIFVATPAGRLVHANTALAHMLGYATPAALLANLPEFRGQLFVQPEQHDAFERALGRDGRVRDLEVLWRAAGDQRLWVSLNAALETDPAGRATGILSLIHI